MPTRSYRPITEKRAKSLRHAMTPDERHLWYDYLRTCPWKFQRQKAIGIYIVDFICYEAHLIIELDGGQHNDEDAYRHDEARTKYLEAQGLRVLRFSNRDVRSHFDSICALIEQALENPAVHGHITSDAVFISDTLPRKRTFE